MEGFVRRATKDDIPALEKLLVQVNMVHHILRPDLFNGPTVKYTDDELRAVLTNDDSPVFVYEGPGGEVLGHAFCLFRTRDNLRLFTPVKTLYIDDICVDEGHRGQGIASALYDAVLKLARESGCYNITLNVYEDNGAALAFYRSRGMKVQSYSMETIL